MLSALSSQGKVRFMLYQDTMNQRRLIRFMERLVRGAEQKVFLILDDLKVHHGKLAAAWLEKNEEKIEAFFLPPYAPEYDPDEYLNHALKISVHSGQLPYPTEDIFHIRSNLSCENCSIIPLLFPTSSSTPCFPVFTRRSNKEAVHLIEGISAETLLADRGYDTNDILSYAVSAGMEPVIPPKKDRKEHRDHDKYLYKLRHLVENCFLALKRWRGIATRYAKTSDAFIAAVHVRCIAIWAAIRS